ncbi:MAG: methylated-DNA--[protein]-cysteine S-methyltransferase [Sphingopyxis sp.]
MAYAPTRAHLATPIGIVQIFGDDAVIDRVTIQPLAHDVTEDLQDVTGALAAAVAQLRDYFAGTRQAFNLPLAPAKSPRGTALRGAIDSVPYGETATYGQLARSHASSSRAMGQACARNPFPIIIPCHRVTSSGGAKENYSGGDGAATKAWLNAHEARIAGKVLI